MSRWVFVAGVDGCAAGWVAAHATVRAVPPREDRPIEFEGAGVRIFGRFEEVIAWAREHRALGIGVDIPIGLDEHAQRGGRGVDRLMRRLLRHRGSSVFAAPIRDVLASGTYSEALRRSRASSSEAIGISKQCYNIVAKIREVDAVLCSDDWARCRTAECHPELSFAAMPSFSGSNPEWCPCVHPKKSADGRRERLERLEAFNLVDRASISMASGSGRGLKPDDVIDAHACLWSAARWALGEARILSGEPSHDRMGVAMRIIV